MLKNTLTENVVYTLVCEHPGMCTYDISKKLEMTGGRVRHTLSKLKDQGLIAFKFEKNAPRIKKLSYPVDAWSLLPKEMKEELKKICKQINQK